MLFAAERIAAVIPALESHLHQDFKADPEKPVGERVAANDFREVFVGHRGRFLGVGHGDKQPHADLVGGNAGLEIDARAGNTESAADIIERVALRVRGPDTHQLRDFAAPAAAPFGLLGASGDATWIVGLRHEIVLGRHGACLSPVKSDSPGEY